MRLTHEAQMRSTGIIERAGGKALKGSAETDWLADFWAGNYTALKADEDLTQFSDLLGMIAGLRHELRDRLGGRPHIEVEDLKWIYDQLSSSVTPYC